MSNQYCFEFYSCRFPVSGIARIRYRTKLKLERIYVYCSWLQGDWSSIGETNSPSTNTARSRQLPVQLFYTYTPEEN